MAKDFSLVGLKMQEIEQELQKLTASIGEINNYLKDIKTDFTDLEGNAVYRSRGEWEQPPPPFSYFFSQGEQEGDKKANGVHPAGRRSQPRGYRRDDERGSIKY